MARKRMIDPEFWSDEEIGYWSYKARLFYIGLWNFADDCGRFKAHSGLLKSQIFPYDDPKSLKIESIKEEVSKKIVWYNINGSQYGYLRNFNKHQRIDKPQPSKLPSPPPIKFQEHSPNNRGTVPPNIREVNIREENIKETAASPALQAAFEEIYKAGLNIYALINKLKKQSKVGAQIPEEVLLRVFETWRKDKDQIKDQWPWFCRVIAAEWGAWNANQEIKQGQEWKKTPISPAIVQILKGLKCAFS